jgi:hypothetical protein
MGGKIKGFDALSNKGQVKKGVRLKVEGKG